MFRWLIWGIVRLCRSNMTRDMIKNWKVEFSKNVNFHTLLLWNFCVKIFVSFHHLSRLQFSSYINNQHLIWKLWCLMFIWYPSEVAEAISLASATLRSDRWQSHRKSKVQILTFFEKSTFQLFIISRDIFDLKRRTIAQINHVNIFFRPFELTFRARMDIWGDTKQGMCPVFFSPDLFEKMLP